MQPLMVDLSATAYPRNPTVQPLIVKLSECRFINLAHVSMASVFQDGTVRVGYDDDTKGDFSGAEAARLLAALKTLANDNRRLTDAGDVT